MDLKGFKIVACGLVLGVLLPSGGWSVSIDTPDKTWDGGGGDSLWSTAANWDLDSAPVNGDLLHFAGTGVHSVNDYSDIRLSKILFNANAGAFTLEGSTITFSDAGQKTIENDGTATQTIALSGSLLGLQTVNAKAGTLVINSTVTASVDGLYVVGGSTVVFNKPVIENNLISVTAYSTAQFNATVSTSIALDHATVIISSATQLPGADISEFGILKIISDVTLNGHIGLVNEGFTYHTIAPTIDTNGHNLVITGGLKDAYNASHQILPAQLIKTGEGTLTVDGDNTLDGWSGGTTVLGGTLKAGTSTAFRPNTSFTLGNATGATLDLNGYDFTFSELNGGGTAGGTVLLGTATLTVNSASTDSRFDGQILGTGGLIKTGGGTLWLTGPNTYTGSTLVSSGTLKGDGRGLQGNIVNHASVVFDQTGEGTFIGQISGDGGIEKMGAGTLTLPGANSFSGGATVSAGTLAVGDSGALGVATVTVTGGTLQGDGHPRRIDVGTNYVQTGGTLGLTLYGAGAGQQDQLHVTGNASLGGTLTIGVQPYFLPVGIATYAVVAANTLSGQFQFNPTGVALEFHMAYSGTDAVLTAIKNPFATPFAGFTKTSNENKVAGYLDSLYPTATGDLALVMGELNALPGQDLTNALKSLSPQSYQTVTTMDATVLTGFFQRIHSQLARARLGKGGIQTTGFETSQSSARWGSLTAEAGTPDVSPENDPFFVPEKKWGAFITGDGLYATIPGDDDVESGNVVSGGLTSGVDYRLSPQWTLGLGFAYALSNSKTGTDLLKIDGKNLTPGLYGSYNSDRYYVDSVLALQNSAYTSKRRVQYGTQNFVAEASPKGQAVALGMEAGIPTRVGLWGLVPVGGVQLSQEKAAAFNESGAGAVSLAVGEQKRESFATTAGIRVERPLTEDTRDRLEIRSAWRHEFLGTTTIDASFAGAGGNFSVSGSYPQKDSVLVGADFSAGFSDSLSLIISYDGDFGSVMVHRIHGGAQFRF